jgi:IgGFc binding protein
LDPAAGFDRRSDRTATAAIVTTFLGWGLGVAVAVAVTIAVTISGCASPATAVADASAGPDSSPGMCTVATVCDGKGTVRACRAGRPAEVVDTCDAGRACNRGRCTSQACAATEQGSLSFLGCVFFTLPVDNVMFDDVNTTTSVLVTNPGQAVATVVLEQRDPSGVGWTTVLVQAVAPTQSARLVLPGRGLDGGGYGKQAALRLTSDAPISAVHIQSDDALENATSSGGTMLLPDYALGIHYMAITYPQVNTQRVMDTPGARAGAGQVIIVGTQDNTRVTFQVSAHASLGLAGGAPPRGPGGSFDIVLEEGDIYQIFSINDGDDLTGSEITSDLPVAVFSGNISTSYGRANAGINTPDMAHEQLLPMSAWGSSFVAAQLPPEANACDGLLGRPDASLWRIVAGRDQTVVSFDRPAAVVGTPDTPITLARGEVREMVVSGGSFLVTASGPIQAMQGMDCEPTMSPAVATAPQLTDLRFAVLPNFDQLAAVVRPVGMPVKLDEDLIPDASFSPAGNGFEVAQVHLDPCPHAMGVCTHHLAGKFGMTLRGMDVVCSYALTASTFPCADPESGTCVP